MLNYCVNIQTCPFSCLLFERLLFLLLFQSLSHLHNTCGLTEGGRREGKREGGREGGTKVSQTKDKRKGTFESLCNCSPLVHQFIFSTTSHTHLHTHSQSYKHPHTLIYQVRPKMGKLTIDYQKLHDAFFKYVHESTNMIIWVVFPQELSCPTSCVWLSHSRIILEWDLAHACVYMYIIFRPELLMSDLQVADKAQDVHPWRPVLWGGLVYFELCTLNLQVTNAYFSFHWPSHFSLTQM